GAEEGLCGPPPLGFTSVPEQHVQFIKIGHARHGGGEPALDSLDGRFGIGLLVATAGHAEAGLEDVVAGQGGVSRMEVAVASLKDERGDRFGVVPPDLPRHTAEELESRDHPFENGLGAFERQGEDEGGVRVGPGGDEEGNQATAIGEVDVNMSEVGFETLAREMSQRDEGFLLGAFLLEQVTLYLSISADVSVFVAELPEQLHRGMALFGGSVLVVAENLFEDRQDRSEHRWESRPGRRAGTGLR